MTPVMMAQYAYGYRYVRFFVLYVCCYRYDLRNEERNYFRERYVYHLSLVSFPGFLIETSADFYLGKFSPYLKNNFINHSNISFQCHPRSISSKEPSPKRRSLYPATRSSLDQQNKRRLRRGRRREVRRLNETGEGRGEGGGQR